MPTVRTEPAAAGRRAPSAAPGRPVEMPLADVGWTDPRATIQAGSRLLSPRVGLIQAVGRGVHLAQDPAVHSLGVRLTDVSRFSDVTHTSKSGGAGIRMDAALAAAIGEAVERYCMNVYDRRGMVLATHREVAADAVHPDEVRLYSRRQLETEPGLAHCEYFDERSRIRWVWGWSLTAGRPRLVPAGLVYLDYRIDGDQGEVAVGRNASSGLAAGLTLEEAILNGVLELIERDSFTVCWQQRRAGPRIRVDDDELREVLRRDFYADHPAVDLRIFDNTLDVGVPSLFAVLRRPAELGPMLCVGSTARIDPRAAVVKCLNEIAQSPPYFRHLMAREPEWRPAADFSNLTGFDEHARLYLYRPDLIPEAFGFCDRVEEEVALSAIPDRSTGRPLGDLRYLVERLREAGSEVVVVDITTPDVGQVGFSAVRVLATRLVPLHGNHLKPFLAPSRLYEVPERLAWRRHGWDPEAGLNPFPHPFP